MATTVEEHAPPLTKETLLEMYRMILLARRLDERAWVLHRQGKIAFHISGIGHEAAQVGAAFAIHRGKDWVVPYYRDLAMLLSLGLTPREFALSIMGKKGDPSSGGRQMPSHWSLRRANVVSHSSPVATQTTHAVGIALGIKMAGDDAIALTSVGEGSTAQGEWYEGVNWAAIHSLPVIFLIENNMYAISVRQEKEMAVEHAAEKAAGLGLPGVSVDGMDVLAVRQAVSEAAARARAGEGPTLIETRVYRLTPHSSDDDDRSYRSREEVEEWRTRDPLDRYAAQLTEQEALTPAIMAEMDERAKREVEEAIRFAEQAPYPEISEGSYPVYAEDGPHA
jgi:2-oxoisovalerate dehydrogenase E1 component alpha subunit